MAYEPKSLRVLAYANGFTLWHYRTKDELPELTRCSYYNVETDPVEWIPGYFGAAADMLRAGDLIICNILDSFGIVYTHLLSVTINEDQDVYVSSLL